MRPSLLFSLAVVLATGCGSVEDATPNPDDSPASVDPRPTETTSASSRLQPTDCRFLIPKSVEGTTVRCADLSVPENRRTENSRSITLHVAIFKGKKQGTPTIELNGGPGGSSDFVVGLLAANEAMISTDYESILAEGDLVFFDQRGTGRSVPSLYCSETQSPASCARRLSEIADLSAYDTVENAEDVHDLKEALGVPKVNLHGISYGTRLGVEVMRRHPEDIQAAILDGVLPPDVPLAATFDVALNDIFTKVFDACRSDAKCSSTYPKLDESLSSLRKRLDDAPPPVDHPLYGPISYTWPDFVSDTIQGLMMGGTARALPFLVHRTSRAKADEFQEALAQLHKKEAPFDTTNNPLMKELEARIARLSNDELRYFDMAYGFYFSVVCNDYIQHESRSKTKEILANIRPELADTSLAEETFSICDSWPIRPSDPKVRTPATFAGPALVIGAELDPSTPSIWAERVASTLTRDQLVVVPDDGHGLMGPCGGALKGSFLGNPSGTVDASCATQHAFTFYYEGEGAKRARPRSSAWHYTPTLRRLNAPGTAPLASLDHARPMVKRTLVRGW